MTNVINTVIHVLRMMFETRVRKQGNSNVVILPAKLGLKPHDRIKILIIDESVSTVGDIAGLFKKELSKINTDALLKKVKRELWGD